MKQSNEICNKVIPKQMLLVIRGGSRTATTSKMELMELTLCDNS